MPGTARVGTSGWVYAHWKGTFYPQTLPQKERLAYYSERLKTVEVNNTYYKLASENALRNWLATVPPDFTFAFKAHRYITHQKRLLDAGDSVRTFFERLAPILERTDVVLFQLPPFMPFDPERLDAFLAELPDDRPCRFVFEFRNPTWHNEQTLEILSSADIGLCIHDFEQEPWLETTSQTIYVRLHGPAGPYQGRYTRAALHEWEQRIRAWTREGRDVWVYFNNDQEGFAAHNAIELARMLDEPSRGTSMERARA